MDHLLQSNNIDQSIKFFWETDGQLLFKSAFARALSASYHKPIQNCDNIVNTSTNNPLSYGDMVQDLTTAINNKNLTRNNTSLISMFMAKRNLVDVNAGLPSTRNLDAKENYLRNDHAKSAYISKSEDNFIEEIHMKSVIKSLKWQLSQIESSHQIYHSILIDVERFLEQCHYSLESINKSNSPIYRQFSYQTINELASTSESYLQFKDFTWRRRSKGKTRNHRPKNELQTETEKLAQDAFRLMRTVQNILCLNSPNLNDSQCVPTTTIKRPIFIKSSPVLMSSNFMCSSPLPKLHGSRTDGKRIACESSGAADDESGFGSLNSYQEIGLPLSSTIQSSPSTIENFSEESFRLNKTLKSISNSLEDECAIENATPTVLWV